MFNSSDYIDPESFQNWFQTILVVKAEYKWYKLKMANNAVADKLLGELEWLRDEFYQNMDTTEFYIYFSDKFDEIEECLRKRIDKE